MLGKCRMKLDLILMGHCLVLLTSVAQLPLGLIKVGNSSRTVEDFCDLFQRVAAGLGEGKVGHCKEYDQQAADWAMSAIVLSSDTGKSGTHKRYNSAIRYFPACEQLGGILNQSGAGGVRAVNTAQTCASNSISRG